MSGPMRIVESPTDPARSLVAVTTSDTADDPNGPFRSLLVGASGTVKLRTLDDQDVTVTLAGGEIHRIRVRRVFTTGTTATGLFGVN